MRKRARQPNLQKLGNVLQGILNKHNIVIDSEERKLMEIWQKAVGTQISSHTRPERLKRNTLFVKVSSSAWLQQLSILKNEIIKKINGLVEKELIRDIYFSIGEVSSKTPKHSFDDLFSPDSYPLKDKEKKMIEKNIAAVKDTELKDILKRVMTKNIIRRKLAPNRKAH